ncbi:fimbrial protein [Enterobacter hormaechei]
MKKNKHILLANLEIIGATLLVSLVLILTSNNATAKDKLLDKGQLSEINIRLSGNIIALACTVEPADVEKTVSLGDWATKQLHYPAGHSDPVAFSIHLTGCTASGVTLAFTGTKDSADSSLLALNEDSTASGVAVEIMDEGHKRISMGDTAERVVVDRQGDAVLNFSARYLAVATPSAGTADADSEFTLTYD